MIVLGIDDAGRGPVIGPMVLAGCLIREEHFDYLFKLGVKDSKELTQKRRLFLKEKILEIAEDFEIILTHPEELDNFMENRTNLNTIEAIKTAEIINKIIERNPEQKIRVVVDCPSVSIISWTDELKLKINDLRNLEIVCEHKADKNHIPVSAASILAKTKREEEMEKLKEKYGIEIGSGYASDPITAKFLEKYLQKYKDDGIFRKSWETFQRAKRDSEQMKLF